MELKICHRKSGPNGWSLQRVRGENNKLYTFEHMIIIKGSKKIEYVKIQVYSGGCVACSWI